MMRRASVALLGMLAVVTITVVSVGYWARQQVLSTDRFVAALSALPADPDVQNSVTALVLSEVEAQITAGVRAQTPALAPLVGDALDLARPAVERASRSMLGSPQFASAWNDAVADLHRQAIAAVRPTGSTLPVTDVLVVNLDALGDVVRSAIEPYVPPDLAHLLDVQLPPYRLDLGEGLVRARRIVRLSAGVLIVSGAVAVVALGWCLGLAQRRSLVLAAVALGVAVAAAITYGVSHVGEAAVSSALLSAAERSAALAVYAAVGQSLRSRSMLVGGVALVIGLVAALVNSTTSARPDR